MTDALPEVIFDLALAHGRCIAVRIPDGAAAVDVLGARGLVGVERAFAAGLAPARRRTWVSGRLAMRLALGRMGIDAPALLADARGAPILPPGVIGSISHKGALAAALVAREDDQPLRAFADSYRVGVDVENDVIGKVDIASRVLAADEAIELAPLEAAARARDVLLRFSAKEAIYKALDPYVRRYVSFQEVSVSPDTTGEVHVTPRLRAGEGPFAIAARWRRFDGIVLTTARVARLAARSL